MLRQLLPRAGRAFRAPAARQLLPLSLAARQPVRYYSIQPEAASRAKPVDVDSSRLSITKTTDPKELKDPATLIFGREFTGTDPTHTCVPYYGRAYC